MFIFFCGICVPRKSVKMQLADLLKLTQSVVFCALLTFAKANIFILEPEHVNVVDLEGAVVDDVTLSCKANLTNAIYHWKKDGEVISAGERYKFSENGTLTINPLRVSDAGNYQCMATSDEETALSNSAKLQITFISEFGPRSKTSYTTEAGKGIAIPCEKANFAPDNSVYFFWEAIDAFIIYGKPGRAEYYVSQDGTLYFANPTTDLTDAYFCFIRDKWNLPSGRRIEKSSHYIALKVSKSNKLHPPTILLNPKNVTYAKVGSTVMLECFAGGNPTPTLKWTKINGSLPSNHVITEAGQLELRDLTHDVTGTYRCTASIEQDSKTTQGEVIVSEPLFLKRRIFSQNVDFHKSATFSCKAVGIPPPTYKWLKNTVPINVTSRVSVSVGMESGSVMTIAEVGDDDMAIYQCVAENPLESLTSNAVLRIKELAPRFVTGIDTRVVKSMKNKASVLKCTVKGYPRPRIYWITHGANITSNVKISNKGSIIESSLLIQTSSNSGNYSCTATNKKGNISKARRLVVYEPTVAVAVKVTIEVLRGQNQTLQCKETHDERLETKWSWTHVVGEIKTDVVDNAEGTLQLKEVGDGQAGSYKCCISSKFDRNCATIHLSIADLPTTPIHVDVIKSSVTSQHLTWDDQSSGVIQYKVEGRLKQENDWFTFDCDVNKPCYASNLLPYNEYVYRVYSINKYGMSNASEISKPRKTLGRAPSLAPSGVNTTLKDGNILVTWNTYPTKYYGSAKVIYTVKYRIWDNATADDGNVCSEWNETHSSATSTLITIPKRKKDALYQVKVAVGNEFGKSSFSELFNITTAAAQDEKIIPWFILPIVIVSALAVLLFVRKRKLKGGKERGSPPENGSPVSEHELYHMSTKDSSSNKTSQQNAKLTDKLLDEKDKLLDEKDKLLDEKDKLLDEKDKQANLRPTVAIPFQVERNFSTKEQPDLHKSVKMGESHAFDINSRSLSPSVDCRTS